MKKIILSFCILFSSLNFAQADSQYTSDDFDAFPLTTSNSDLVEGVWTGKSVIIEVNNMNLTYDGKAFMWVTILHKFTNEEKKAPLYFNEEHDSYELYVFGLAKSVPLEIMIFKYTDQIAFERQMKCKTGGYVMRLKFSIEGSENQAVELQRETCSGQ